jgi:hypothetical protein
MGGFTGLAPVGFPNVALSNFMKEFRNNAMMSEIIAPRVPVTRQSFPYVIFDRSGQRLDQSTLRAPGTRPQTIRMTYSTGTYFAHDHALDAEVPWETEQYGLGLGFSTKQKSIQMLMQKLLLDREVQIANLVTNSANIPNYLDLGTGGDPPYPWDDYTSGTSHPIVDIDNGKEVIRQSGVDANWLIISDPTYVALRNHPDILERFKYTTLGGAGGSIGVNELSSVFGVKTYVASAIVLDKGNNGSWVWGANALLGHTDDSPGLQDVSCLKTFVWTQASAGRGPDGTDLPSTDGYSVLEWPDAHLSTKKDWASGSWYYDIRVTAPETAYLFKRTCTPAAFGSIAAPTGE